MVAVLVPVLVPVFLAVAVGFGWARFRLPFDRDFVTRIVTLVGTPCLAFSAITQFDGDLLALGEIALAAAIAIAVFMVVGALILRLSGQPVAGLLPSLMLPNAGNMGLPVCLFAFGPEGLGLAFGFAAVVIVGHFTVGVMLAAGRVDWRELALAPVIWSLAAAVLFQVFDWTVPVWLANTAQLLGGLTIPLMLLSLGVSLASLKIRLLRLSLGLGLLRLGMGAGVGLALGPALGLDPVASGVVALQSAMPTAVYNYLMAARYGGPADAVAGAVVVSTILSLITLPPLILLVL